MNDFKQCLAFSHEAEDMPIWEQVYKSAFPDMAGMVSYRADGFWQREGVDRGILLSTTKQIFVDEKVRGRNKRTGKVYDDVSLEYLSNDQTDAPGWVCKPLRADYIAYLIAPLGVCHFLPVVQLQIAWRENGEQWRSKYGERNARNATYDTWFCPVPVKALYPAIGKALRVQFDRFEFAE